jgi:hypothetical protein
MKRYWCDRDKKYISQGKAFKECMLKNDGTAWCGQLVIRKKKGKQ